MLRDTQPGDTDELCHLATLTGVFYDHEVDMLRKVLDDYHEEEQYNDHHSKTWEDGGVRALLYYAPVEMTDRTWDLWWIIVDPTLQGQGLGKRLMSFVEADLRERGGRLLLIETSALPRYEPTSRFYKQLGYREVARIPDFYTTGDDKIVYARNLTDG